MIEKMLIALINVSCQFALIFATAWLIAKIPNMRSASTRHIIWLCVIISPIILLSANMAFPDLAFFQVDNLKLRAGNAPISSHTDIGLPKGIDIKIEQTQAYSLDKPDIVQAEPKSPSIYSRLIANTPGLLMFAWVSGIATNFVLTLFGYIRLNRLIFNAQEIKDGHVIQIFNQVKDELQISRNIQILTSDKAQSPFSIGFKYPSIILPPQTLDSGDNLRMILSHEAIDLKRFDHQVNLICRIILSFMFFHPLYYLAFREFALTTEQICDGWTIKITGMKDNYADCLIELSRACIGRLPIGFGLKGSSITKRIKAIFNNEEEFKMISRKGTVLLVVLSFMIVVIFSSVRVAGFTPVTRTLTDINPLPSTQPQNPFNIGEYKAKNPGFLALADNPKNPPTTDVNSQLENLYETAERRFMERKYKEAIDNYTKVLEEAGKPGVKLEDIDQDFINVVKLKIASCYFELGSQTEDPEMYKKSLEMVPDIYNSAKAENLKASLLSLWGQNYFRLKQNDDAIAKLKELTEKSPDTKYAENAYYLLGTIYSNKRQHSLARDAYKAVVEKFPKSVYAYRSQFFIADSYVMEGNFGQALTEFQKIQTSDPLIPIMFERARYSVGLSLFRLGRNQEALTAYQEFIADLPDSGFAPAAYFDMAVIYQNMKEYDKANRNYEEALLYAKNDMTKGAIQFGIGNNFFGADNYLLALKAYQKLIDLYPKDTNIPEAKFMLAECYWALKDYKNAQNAYNEILKDASMADYADKATYKIGEYYYQMGNKDKALEWYQKVIDGYSKSSLIGNAFIGKIKILKDQKQYDEVQNVGYQFIAKYKTDSAYTMASAEIQMVLGDVKFDAGNYISATGEYQKTLSDYPDSPGIDPFKCRSLLQMGIAYYKEASNKNMDSALLQKSVSAFEKLLDQYEKNFDKAKRDFKSRTEYINSAKTYMEMASSKSK